MIDRKPIFAGKNRDGVPVFYAPVPGCPAYSIYFETSPGSLEHRGNSRCRDVLILNLKAIGIYDHEPEPRDPLDAGLM